MKVDSTNAEIKYYHTLKSLGKCFDPYNDKMNINQILLHCYSFNPAKDLTFMPVSGQNGSNLKEILDESLCPWYRGPSFITFIDDLPSLNRKLEGPFIMPVVDKYKDMGTVVMGKVESGFAKKGQNLLVMPNRTNVSVDQLWSDDEEVTSVGPGENVKIKLKVNLCYIIFFLQLCFVMHTFLLFRVLKKRTCHPVSCCVTR